MAATSSGVAKKNVVDVIDGVIMVTKRLAGLMVVVCVNRQAGDPPLPVPAGYAFFSPNYQALTVVGVGRGGIV